MDYVRVTVCRVCGSPDLKKYLDLGNQPLPNNLLKPNSPANEVYPLQVLFCRNCSLSQLSVVMDPKLMFSVYLYHSSVSDTFKKHCYEMGKKIKKLLDSNIKLCFDFRKRPRISLDHLVIDVASNDGCLLEQFKKLGFRTIGIEPAKNLVNESIKKGIPTVEGFFDDKISSRIPVCDVITATNILAHVDDVKLFLKIAGSKLSVFSKGIMVIEVPYVYDLIKGNQFDTIYHEHLSYFTFTSLKMLFDSVNIPIFRVERIKIHGGSLRIFASPFSYSEHRSVKQMIKFELRRKLGCFSTYSQFEKKVLRVKRDFLWVLKNLRYQGKLVMAYCASAKGISLINYCGIDSSLIQYIIDETLDKQYMEIPNSRILVLPPKCMNDRKPDYLVILSWNFSKEVILKTKHYGAKYIIPIPILKVKR